jgi:hypothetical protein
MQQHAKSAEFERSRGCCAICIRNWRLFGMMSALGGGIHRRSFPWFAAWNVARRSGLVALMIVKLCKSRFGPCLRARREGIYGLSSLRQLPLKTINYSSSECGGSAATATLDRDGYRYTAGG